MAGQKQTASFDLDDKAFKAALDSAFLKVRAESDVELEKLAIKVVNKAQRYCPVKTNRLRSSIGIQERGVTPDGSYIDVGTKLKYAPPVEYGSQEHEVTIKSKKVLANKKTGEIFGKKVTIPMQPAQPYMRPALLEAGQEWGTRL